MKDRIMLGPGLLLYSPILYTPAPITPDPMTTPKLPEGYRLLADDERNNPPRRDRLISWSEEQKEWQPSMGLVPGSICAIPEATHPMTTPITDKQGTPHDLQRVRG
jgi:hypothetical protein